MESNTSYEPALIAPCGMNCGICLAYLRERNKCYGCMGDNLHKAHHCTTCRIKNCGLLAKTSSGFCYECTRYPCTRLKQLDKRYRQKYTMSMIENMDAIQQDGLDAFTDNERVRWSCPICGGTVCVHTGTCLNCDKSL